MAVFQYRFKAADINKLSDAGVTLTVNGEAVVAETAIYDGDELLAVVESGREFNIIKDNEGVNDILSIYFRQFDSWAFKTYYAPFINSGNFKSATLTMPNKMVDGIGSSPFTFSVSTIQALPEVVGTNNIYKVDVDILSDVNRERFKVVVSGSGGEVNDTIYDYGKYILSVLSLPFKIPDNYIALEDNILLADLNTGVRAVKLNSDVLKIKLGTINLSNYSKNSSDYLDVITILHLPYVNSINIEPYYVLDSVLDVEYLVDCYTGVVTVNVYSDKLESPIVTKSVNMGVNIPMVSTEFNVELSNSNIERGGDNGVRTPFIEVVKSELPLMDGVFTIPVIDESILNSNTGFIQVSEINLNGRITSIEQSEIKSILNSGVFING